ncbi:MAG: ETC complex I subunit [Alphaproteobacteria bacterium]|nr:ETC complex I subunit [Alphaproteobacteria bacterium]
MLAIIYQPAKTAMQSGRAKTKRWVLEFEADSARRIDPLMGWTSSSDTKGQVHIQFDTREAAVAYAERNNIPYQVVTANARRPAAKAYADNFAFRRRQPWTH